MNSIDEKDINNSNDIDDNLNKQDLALIKLGKEYRSNYKKNKKRIVLNTIISCITTLIIGYALVAFIFSQNKKAYSLFGAFAIIATIIFFIFSGNKELNNLNKELENDDKWLGFKHRFKNKHVKGAAKTILKTREAVSLIFFAITLGFGLFILGLALSQKPAERNNLVAVYLPIEYADKTDDSVVIGLKGSNTQYNIPSYATKALNKEFWDEVKINQYAVIWIDSTESPRNKSVNGKDNWTYMYGLTVSGVQYYSYLDYLQAFDDNRSIGLSVSIISLSISAGSSVMAIVFFIIYKKNSKNENIEL